MTGLSIAAGDGVRLFAWRRARTLGAPDQIRLVATAFFVFMLLDLVHIGLVVQPVSNPAYAHNMTMDVLSYVAILVALWRPTLGIGLALIPLTASLIWGPVSMDFQLMFVSMFIGVFSFSTRRAWLLVVGLALFISARLLLHQDPETLGLLALTLGGPFLIGGGLGFIARRFRVRSERAAETAARLRQESARIRADERRALTRELHDVITHQLSNGSLQIMGHADSDDPGELRTVLTRVESVTESALTELRLLVRVLDDDSQHSGDEIRALSQRVPPTMAAANASVRLIEAGFEPEMRIPASADQLEMTVQRTLTRVIDEATDNILRHAQPGSRSFYGLVQNDTQVTLTITSKLPEHTRHRANDHMGWGLRGLTERVELTGGSFSAGPLRDQWMVTVTLPHD